MRASLTARATLPGAVPPKLLRAATDARLEGAIPLDEVEAHFTQMPAGYFRHVSSEDAATHIRMIHRLIASVTAADADAWRRTRLSVSAGTLTITGAFIYDHDGFPKALELLASGAMPLDVLVEADDVPLDGLVDACVALNDGALAAKVMVVPRVGNAAT